MESSSILKEVTGRDRSYPPFKEMNLEYQVYECNPDNEHEFISEPLFESDRLDEAHSWAYRENKASNKATVIYQPKYNYLRGGYGWGFDIE